MVAIPARSTASIAPLLAACHDTKGRDHRHPPKNRDGSRDPVGYHAGKKVKDIRRNAVADMLYFVFSKAEAATLSLKQYGLPAATQNARLSRNHGQIVDDITT